jgi:hypothetical protein
LPVHPWQYWTSLNLKIILLLFSLHASIKTYENIHPFSK